MGLIRAATLQSYVAALESVCMDCELPIDIFENKQVRCHLASIVRRQYLRPLSK